MEPTYYPREMEILTEKEFRNLRFAREMLTMAQSMINDAQPGLTGEKFADASRAFNLAQQAYSVLWASSLDVGDEDTYSDYIARMESRP